MKEFFKSLFRSSTYYLDIEVKNTRTFIESASNNDLLEFLKHPQYLSCAAMVILELFKRHEKEIADLRDKTDRKE